MLLTANGARVLEGTVALPCGGAWTASLVLDTEAPPAGRIALLAPGLSLVGTVKRSGASRGSVSVLAVGGAGRLGVELAPRSYRAPSVRHVVEDALREAGEALSPLSDPALLARVLPAWSRARGSAGRAIDVLLARAGGAWRVADDGLVWVGLDTWPPASLSGVVLAPFPARARVLIGPESASLRPGTALEGRRVVRVTYQVSPHGARAEVDLA